MSSTQAELDMAGFLVARSARKAQATSNGKGQCSLRLTFEN